MNLTHSRNAASRRCASRTRMAGMLAIGILAAAAAAGCSSMSPYGGAKSKVAMKSHSPQEKQAPKSARIVSSDIPDASQAGLQSADRTSADRMSADRKSTTGSTATK